MKQVGEFDFLISSPCGGRQMCTAGIGPNRPTGFPKRNPDCPLGASCERQMPVQLLVLKLGTVNQFTGAGKRAEILRPTPVDRLKKISQAHRNGAKLCMRKSAEIRFAALVSVGFPQTTS
uniref:Uncharacterized protein n=1 Tax=Anopheles melas TaxID=34690 RepID=A0A182UCI1_9DIPT